MGEAETGRGSSGGGGVGNGASVGVETRSGAGAVVGRAGLRLSFYLNCLVSALNQHECESLRARDFFHHTCLADLTHLVPVVPVRVAANALAVAVHVPAEGRVLPVDLLPVQGAMPVLATVEPLGRVELVPVINRVPTIRATVIVGARLPKNSNPGRKLRLSWKVW